MARAGVIADARRNAWTSVPAQPAPPPVMIDGPLADVEPDAPVTCTAGAVVAGWHDAAGLWRRFLGEVLP
jgi:hypothetical protein